MLTTMASTGKSRWLAVIAGDAPRAVALMAARVNVLKDVSLEAASYGIVLHPWVDPPGPDSRRRYHRGIRGVSSDSQKESSAQACGEGRRR
jgi:hypothetical protein